MRLSRFAAAGVVLAGVCTLAAGMPAADEPAPEPMTLMGVLSPWFYPDAKMPDGASMSDGGNPLIQSVKCKAILTTPDPFEKVVAFYSTMLEPPRNLTRTDEKPPAKIGDAKSVVSQDDSRENGVAMRVFVVNKAETTTTLVISRAPGEKETHVAWSHYARLGK